jgi:hypothetical protein
MDSHHREAPGPSERSSGTRASATAGDQRHVDEQQHAEGQHGQTGVLRAPEPALPALPLEPAALEVGLLGVHARSVPEGGREPAGGAPLGEGYF